MKFTIASRATLATLGLGAFLLVPVAAAAMNVAPATYQFDTRFTKEMSAGEIPGRLRLTIEPDGIVNGTYRDLDGNRVTPVRGGLTGTNIWLDLGLRGRTHLTGTFEDGKIVATTVARNDFHPGLDSATFEADPATSANP